MSSVASGFRRAGGAGLFTLSVAVVLFLVLPQKGGALPPGFRTPILAFELARTKAEVEGMFGPAGSAERAALVRSMNLGNSIDFAFMAAYGSFLGLLGLAVGRVSRRRYAVVSALGALGVLFDVGENVQLFSITRSLGGDYAEALARLSVFTWLKWETLALALLGLSPWLLRGTRTARVTGVLSLSGALLGGLAYLDRTTFAEPFSVTVSLTFTGLWIVTLQVVRAA